MLGDSAPITSATSRRIMPNAGMVSFFMSASGYRNSIFLAVMSGLSLYYYGSMNEKFWGSVWDIFFSCEGWGERDSNPHDLAVSGF